MKYLLTFIFVLAIYYWKGWVYETDRPVIILNDVLVFKDDGKPVPPKERCTT